MWAVAQSNPTAVHLSLSASSLVLCVQMRTTIWFKANPNILIICSHSCDNAKARDEAKSADV